MTDRPPDFDRIARAYRWLEYLTLGPLLERTRVSHIALVKDCSQALILGDGDGRFTARLLTQSRHIRVQAVDLSRVMLHLLRTRCIPNQSRLQTFQRDARDFTPQHETDLVVTHFFLDCLTQSDVDGLVSRLTPQLKPNARWVVSDFRIPDGVLRWPARIYIRLLYFAFRLLTGLRTTRLPNHSAALERCGFAKVASQQGMLGMLTSEVWQRKEHCLSPTQENATERRPIPLLSPHVPA
jgi:ubiquinone/menaquinone biosynthesis C-methylase UbiE